MLLHKTNGQRRQIALVLGLILALTLSACAPGGADDPAEPDTTEATATTEAAPVTTEGDSESADTPDTTEAEGEAAGGAVVKVGFLSPVTGPLAAIGTEMKEGWELYWEENGVDVGDYTVETIYEDDAGNPDTALTKARRLVEDENVDVVVGPLAANTALAVADYLIQQGIPNFHPVTAADDLTQRLADPLVIRVGAMTGSQATYVAGQWAYDQGYRKAITLCSDYAFGWENCGGFVRTFTAAGGEVVDQLWNPLGTPDFSSYATQIASSGADVAFIGSSGGTDGTNFMRAYEDFGLGDQIEVLGNCCLLDQATLADAGEMAVGLRSVTYWAEGRESPEVERFIELYDEAYGGIPSLYVANSYTAGHVFSEALKASQGEIDPEGLVAAAQEVNLEDSVFGPRRIDEWNNPVGNVYITRVEQREDGSYWNVVEETYEEVSQFWTFDPQEILDSPAYDRTNTGQQ